MQNSLEMELCEPQKIEPGQSGQIEAVNKDQSEDLRFESNERYAGIFTAVRIEIL